MTVLYLPIVDGQDEERSETMYEVIQTIFMTKINEMEFQDEMDPNTKIY